MHLRMPPGRAAALSATLVASALAPRWAVAQGTGATGVDRLALSGPLLLAAGDTGTVVLVHRMGAYHFSEALPTAAAWTSIGSTDPRVLAVDAEGHLLALAPGWATVGAVVDTQQLRFPIQVLPAIARLSFQPRDTTIRVGDSVRLRLRAFDSSGRVVAAPLFIARRAHGRPGPLHQVRLLPPAGLVLLGCAAGSESFATRLVHRADSVTITVSPGSPPRGTPDAACFRSP
jgi:hypothetical protein